MSTDQNSGPTSFQLETLAGNDAIVSGLDSSPVQDAANLPPYSRDLSTSDPLGKSRTATIPSPSRVPEIASTGIEFRVLREGSPTRRLRLRGARYTFGHGDGCSIRLDDDSLRPLHAVMIRDEGRILVRAYSIPIEVNGVRTTEATLQLGDVMRLGVYQFELVSLAAWDAPPSAGTSPDGENEPNSAAADALNSADEDSPSSAANSDSLPVSTATTGSETNGGRLSFADAGLYAGDAGPATDLAGEAGPFAKTDPPFGNDQPISSDSSAATALPPDSDEDQAALLEQQVWRDRLRREVDMWRQRQDECDRLTERCNHREVELRERESELWSRAERLQNREARLKAQEHAAIEIQKEYSVLQQELQKIRKQREEDNKNWEQRNADSRRREQQHRGEAEEAAVQLQHSREQAESATRAVGRMREQLAVLNQQLENISENQNLLEQQEQERLAELERQKIDWESSRELMISQLSTAHIERDKAIDAGAQTEAKRRDAEDRIAEMQSSIDEANRLEKERNAQSQEQERIAAELRNQVNELEASLHASEQEAARLAEQYEDAQDTVAELRRSNEGLESERAQRDEFAVETEELRRSVDELREELSKATEELEQLRHANEELAEKLADMQSERDEAIQFAESLPTQESFAAIRSELAQATDQLTELQKEHADVLQNLPQPEPMAVSLATVEPAMESPPTEDAIPDEPAKLNSELPGTVSPTPVDEPEASQEPQALIQDTVTPTPIVDVNDAPSWTSADSSEPTQESVAPTSEDASPDGNEWPVSEVEPHVQENLWQVEDQQESGDAPLGAHQQAVVEEDHNEGKSPVASESQADADSQGDETDDLNTGAWPTYDQSPPTWETSTAEQSLPESAPPGSTLAEPSLPESTVTPAQANAFTQADSDESSWNATAEIVPAAEKAADPWAVATEPARLESIAPKPSDESFTSEDEVSNSPLSIESAAPTTTGFAVERENHSNVRDDSDQHLDSVSTGFSSPSASSNTNDFAPATEEPSTIVTDHPWSAEPEADSPPSEPSVPQQDIAEGTLADQLLRDIHQEDVRKDATGLNEDASRNSDAEATDGQEFDVQGFEREPDGYNATAAFDASEFALDPPSADNTSTDLPPDDSAFSTELPPNNDATPDVEEEDYSSTMSLDDLRRQVAEENASLDEPGIARSEDAFKLHDDDRNQNEEETDSGFSLPLNSPSDDALSGSPEAGLQEAGSPSQGLTDTEYVESSYQPSIESADTPSPAPMEEPKPAASEGDEDDSIEAYMNRLLQRVQGSPGEPSSVQTSKKDTEPSTTPDSHHETDSPSPPAAFEKAAVQPELQAVTDPNTPLVARSQAPEKTTNLSAMRELANSSARKAVARSTKLQTRDTQLRAMSKLLVAAVFLLCGLGVYGFAPIMIVKVLGLIAGGFMAVIQVREALPLFGDSRRRMLLAETEESEEQEPV
ncbi:MAG: hypothetical protein AAF989_02555 [Planctomycetota bacterium]